MPSVRDDAQTTHGFARGRLGPLAALLVGVTLVGFVWIGPGRSFGHP